jgi:hypothetical protein
VLESAVKQEVPEEDILYAYRLALRSWEFAGGVVMLLGPARDGPLLEVGLVSGAGGDLIVHAMLARTRFLPRGFSCRNL